MHPGKQADVLLACSPPNPYRVSGPANLCALQVSETRSQLVGRFLEQYQLTPAEAAALQVRWSGRGQGRDCRERPVGCCCRLAHKTQLTQSRWSKA